MFQPSSWLDHKCTPPSFSHTHTRQSGTYAIIWERVWHQHQTQTVSELHDTGEQHDARDGVYVCVREIAKDEGTAVNHSTEASKAICNPVSSSVACVSHTPRSHWLSAGTHLSMCMCLSEGGIFGMGGTSEGVGYKGRGKIREGKRMKPPQWCNYDLI